MATYSCGEAMDRKSTYGLKLEQLTKILSLGAADAIPPAGFCDEEMIATHLRSQLAEPLKEDSELLVSLEPTLERSGMKRSDLVGRSLCSVLLDEETGMDLLGAIKTCGKKLSFTVVHETESSIGVTVYHAAIAAALLGHDERISSSSFEELADAFDLLAGKSWMLAELVDLFAKACGVCREKHESKQ